MADLAAIRTALATNLATLQGAPGNVQISPYMLANPTPPTLQVLGPDNIDFDQAMSRGADEWTFIVQGFCCDITDIGGQVNLDHWLAPTGPLSVKAALEHDRTLGGTVHDSFVATCSGYRIYQLENRLRALGAEWAVRALVPGK